MNNEKPKPIGELFNTIQYVSDEDVNNLIENLNDIQSLYFIKLSLDTAIKNNIFNILEIEIISKSLRKLKELTTNIDEPKD
jgi:L-arabinose isomerase